MGETIKQSELCDNNVEIRRRVADGESFTVTVHGQPVANLVPHQWKRDIEKADHIFGDDLPTDPWEKSGQR
ncbi:MAG: type II toxin-antitoxin system Phd/YefM family antitoxin [Pseudonocardiales bacterium]